MPCNIDANERVPDPRLRGMNPSFVKMVWEKRRQEREAKLAARNIADIKPERVIDPIIFNIYAEMPVSERPSAKKIIEETAERHGFTAELLRSNLRFRAVVKARQEAMARIYVERPDISLPMMGRLFGGRDHTTCLHAIVKMGVHDPNRHKRAA